MPTVTVEGEKSFEVEPGKKLVLAIEDAGIDIMHRCGGNARCTTCRVQVVAGEPGPMGDLERERLAREASLGPDIRLSCQIRVDGRPDRPRPEPRLGRRHPAGPTPRRLSGSSYFWASEHFLQRAMAPDPAAAALAT